MDLGDLFVRRPKHVHMFDIYRRSDTSSHREYRAPQRGVREPPRVFGLRSSSPPFLHRHLLALSSLLKRYASCAAMPEIRFSGLQWGGAGPKDLTDTPATDKDAISTEANSSAAGPSRSCSPSAERSSVVKSRKMTGMFGDRDAFPNGFNDGESRHCAGSPPSRLSSHGSPGILHRRGSRAVTNIQTRFEKLTHTHINPFAHHSKHQDLAAGHLRAHDIIHVNTGTFTLDMLQQLFYSSPPVVILVALVLYVATVCVFAAIFTMFGAECFKLEDDDDFGFAPMLWMSIHAFSTIGFGNLAPHQSCVGPQLVLLVETFVSVLTISAIGGYVVKQFLRPLSSVRFSSCFLVNGGRRRVRMEDEDSSEEYRYLTFRMVRRGRVQLRHIQVQVQAQWWDAATTAFGDRGARIVLADQSAPAQTIFSSRLCPKFTLACCALMNACAQTITRAV